MRVPLAAIAASDLTAPIFWTGVFVGFALAALIAGIWQTRRRRALTPDAEPTERAVAATPVRRPIYLARPLLNDLLAHAEPRDFGRGLRASLSDDDLEGNAGDTRMLNKVIAGLRRQRHLIDLDLDPGSPLATGRAVLLTVRAIEHPATGLLSRVPVGAGKAARTGGARTTNGNGNGTTRRRSVPLVLSLTDDRSGRTFAGVIDTRRLRREDRAWMTAPVSVLAVVDEVLSSSDHLPAQALLAGDAPDDLGDVASREYGVDGPGAVLSIAAIYR